MSDVYTPYETGLHALLERLGHDHPRYSDALVYQQRLTENIEAARRYGDTASRRAERAEIVDQLNALALETLGVSYTALWQETSSAMESRPTSPEEVGRVSIPADDPPRPKVPSEGEPQALITAALKARRLLLVWAEVPFLPRRRPTNPPSLVINQWQWDAQALSPVPWPVPQLLPLTILSLDPSDRIEAAFREADVPLNVLCTREDVINPHQHNLIKLAGDLASCSGLLLTWTDVQDMSNDPDKAHLLEEARRVAQDGVVLMVGDAPNKQYVQLWNELIRAYASDARHHFALGPADAHWPKDVKHLSIDVNGVLVRLSEVDVPPLAPAKSEVSLHPETARTIHDKLDRLSVAQNEPTLRYTDVTFPSYAVVQRTEALRVAITLEPTSEQSAELALELPSDEKEPMMVDACLVVSPRDFDLEGPSVQTIEVPLDADSDPVIFKLRPKSVGRKTIAVEFFQDTRYLGRAEVETTVGERVRESHPVSAHSALALRPQQLAPDLTIYIEEASLEKEHRLYRFLLLSPIHEIDLNFEEAGEIELQAPPEIYFEELFAELNDWLGERDVDDDLFSKRLSSLGANLYDQLFPEKLKRIYWEKLRDEVETVQIISADPWIPWELVRPYHPETLEEDDFLCEQFALTRWLAGSSSPDMIDLQRLALVVAASDLSAAEDEAEALRKLPGIEVKDIAPSLLDVYDLLETGGFQGVHFACHGEYDRQNPDQSIVLLEAGQRFRPNDIAGKKCTFGRDEPLVFLNACETGRAGLSLTGLGGWAKAFIAAGAGGFVGSTWQAHDESAYRFAVAFYRQLLEGETVAEAARLARGAIRRAGDPTWLSYTVYANPLARLAARTRQESV
jgi:hypothetical protein